MPAACAPPRTRPAIELADVVRAHGDVFVQSRVLRPEQRAALRDIERCRTAVLGGHLDVCTACGHEEPSYNSCRNRHCPKCQSLAQARWIDKRLERLLPVHYFHVVFTLPSELRGVAMRSREAVFDMLFASASQTLLTLARDPKRLGGELGVTMVLHTWTRELRFHPHVHAIVTGGGLSDDNERWVRARSDFLFPVRVMGDLFRGKMLAALEHAHTSGSIDVGRVDLRALYRKSWSSTPSVPSVTRAGRSLPRPLHPPRRHLQPAPRLDGRARRHLPHQGRQGGHRDGARAARALREHVLPPGFVKIRHYGLHAARHATTRLEVARGRLTSSAVPRDRGARRSEPLDWRELLLRVSGFDVRVCPACSQIAVERTALPIARGRAPPGAA